jgi:anaerobic magnesium-protoporphyrin IX monomethyl ester cyclase
MSSIFQYLHILLAVTHAQAATALKKDGHDVYWDDGNAQLKTYQTWLNDLIKFKPDLIIFETTTPIMRFMWNTVNEVKSKLHNSKIVMSGYHVMRKPNETFEKSKTDIIILSNHVDFVLRKLVKKFNPITSIENYNEPFDSICFRDKSNKIYTSVSFKKIENVNSTEIIDRDLVQWKRLCL